MIVKKERNREKLLSDVAVRNFSSQPTSRRPPNQSNCFTPSARDLFNLGKRGQTAIFVIVAIVIVSGILIYFAVRDGVGEESIPQELAPVFDNYLSCIESEARLAIKLAAAQGGKLDVGEYVPGSEYAPFSSQLNFLGSPVPYWFYVAGNGLFKESVPEESEMEEEIAVFVEEGLRVCDFERFRLEGFEVDVGEPLVAIDVQNDKVVVDVEADLSSSRGDVSARRVSHKVEIDSKFGKFYNLAKEIYSKQKEEAFLEKYALDVLYLYAPVDGVEIQCGPKIWATQNVEQEIKSGLEANLARLKFSGGYYELENEDNEYFVLDKNVDEAVNVLYSSSWPTKIEIEGEGVDADIMMAEAVGTQQGLGAMGFCYVPYHFVYDVSFPVMIQVYNTEEFFQFPVAVVIDNNVAREAVLPEGFAQSEEFDLCQFSDKEIEVNLYDINLNKVDANLSYECFNQRCRLGETIGGKFRGVAPKCVNGLLQIRADGYSDKEQIFSTNKESYADVVLEREYEIEVDARISGGDAGNVIVSFTRDDGESSSVALPEFNTVKLSEGQYEVRAYAYGNSSLTIPATTKYECVDVPREGLLGFFGSTDEKCFDISIPESKIDYALIGGGMTNYYILESELSQGRVEVAFERLPVPGSLDELQQNFELFETRRIDLTFG